MTTHTHQAQANDGPGDAMYVWFLAVLKCTARAYTSSGSSVAAELRVDVGRATAQLGVRGVETRHRRGVGCNPGYGG